VSSALGLQGSGSSLTWGCLPEGSCSAAGLRGSITPGLQGRPTASAVSGAEEQRGRCKAASVEGERQFPKSKGFGFFVGWMKCCLQEVRAK